METGASGRALVIDDEPMIRMMLTDVLEMLGYAVDAADSGEAAIAEFVPGRYDIVVTDFVMPTMDGLQVATALRRLDPAVSLILLTGAGGASVVEDPRSADVPIVYKPVAVMALKAAVDAARKRAVRA